MRAAFRDVVRSEGRRRYDSRGGESVESDRSEGVPLGGMPDAVLADPSATPGDCVSLSVLTPGSVVKLERVPLAATVAEVVNSVRGEPLTDWSEVALLLSRPGRGEPQKLSPQQSLGEAGVQPGDALIHAYTVQWGSGWQEIGLFLASSAGAGVIGGAAYDLLKSTLRTAARRWGKRRSATAASSLSRDEVLRIAQACLAIDAGVGRPGDLKAVSIDRDPTGSGGPEAWTVSFALPHREVALKISVPADGPEHAMIFIDDHAAQQLPTFHYKK
jgi:hypothetical protein